MKEEMEEKVNVSENQEDVNINEVHEEESKGKKCKKKALKDIKHCQRYVAYLCQQYMPVGADTECSVSKICGCCLRGLNALSTI